MFQFQYGSIKSLAETALKLDPSRFQFQYGSIKSAFAGFFCNTLHRFQFQYGSIKSRRTPSLSRLGQVSIPVWFD